MTRRANEDPNFIENIGVSGEAVFPVNGFVNKHNYWDNTNPYVLQEEHSPYPQEITVQKTIQLLDLYSWREI